MTNKLTGKRAFRASLAGRKILSQNQNAKTKKTQESSNSLFKKLILLRVGLIQERICMEFSDWLPDLQVEIKTASIGLLHRHFRWTMNNFCQRTHYWQEPTQPITLLPFQKDALTTYIYPVSVPKYAQLLAIQHFTYDQKILLERSASWLNENLPDWRSMTDQPRFFMMLTPNMVRFVPASKKVQPQAINGRMVLQLDCNGTFFPDYFAEYQEGLINGILARLLVLKDKPWTDGQRAAICQTVYEQTVSEAKERQMRDWNYGPITTASVSWT